MKQKRKVKSLLPQRKDKKTSFLTTLLLVLSTILCIGSASLLTSSVFAADTNYINYEGLPNNVEVLYNLKFADPEDLTGDGVADVYVHDNSLYISPSPVIVNVSGSTNKNEVKTGVYSHILGGEKNTIYSENVTIIAGYNNAVSGGKNSTILGGQHHRLETGAVSIGGNHNEVASNKKGVVFIGGYKNYVLGNHANSNIFILGGENNNINTTGANMVIGGSGVNISGSEINNIFVFSSPKPFTPMGGKAFYLNMENGVGIGTGGVPGGLAVNGAIYINSNIFNCNSGNLGVIYSLYGCLVGCTRASLEVNTDYEEIKPWEILDHSEFCKSMMRPNTEPGDNDFFYQEEVIPETPSYTGYCIPVDFTGHTVPCSTPDVYQNVIFETSIVDNGECTSKTRFAQRKGENKCVFECENGYHLGYDTDYANGGFGTGCYADCQFGNNGRILKHNQTGTLYDVSAVICSDGEKCETCAKHAKNVICKYGTLKELSGGTIRGNIDTGIYTSTECTLRGGYDCVANEYNKGITQLGYINGDNMSKVILWHHASGPLSSQEIEIISKNMSGKKKILNPEKAENYTYGSLGEGQKINWSIITATGARGIYQLCRDYNKNQEKPLDGLGDYKNPNTDCGQPINRYKLVGCNTGYTFTGGNCLPKCKGFLSGDNNYYKYGDILTGYKNSSVLCTNGDCEAAAFKCGTDTKGTTGVWEPVAGFEGKKATDYKFETCFVTAKTCGEGFSLSSGRLHDFEVRDITGYKNSKYESCAVVDIVNGECKTLGTYYKLSGCNEGYHTEDGEVCISNIKIEPCGLSLPTYGVRDRSSEDYNLPYISELIYLLEGHYIVERTGCGRNGVGRNCWSETPQPVNACDWHCGFGSRTGSANNCVIDGKCSKEEKFECIGGFPAKNPVTGDNNEGYYWDCEGDGGKVDSCYLCNSGYSYSGTTHKCEKNVCFGAESNWVLIAGSDENLEKNTKAQLYPSATAAGDNKCAYLCEDQYENGRCVQKDSICGREKFKCNVGEVIYKAGDSLHYKWDCGYDEIIYDSCSLCNNGSTHIEKCELCGDEIYQCYGNVNPTNFQENENSYTWECGRLTCSGAREVLPPEPLKIGTIYKWKYVGPGSSNLKSCTSSTGFNKGGYCFVINEQCVDNSGKMYRCSDSTSWSGYCKGGIYNYDNNTEKIEYRNQYNGFGSFNNFGSVMYDYHPNPLDLCLPSRTTELDSCKVIDGCYKATSSCRSTDKLYFQARYNYLGNYYPECDCERSCLDENSIYKDIKKDFYCKCGTRKDYVYKAVGGCSNTPMVAGCEIAEEKSYDVYLSGTVVYNEKDKKILGDTYNQRCGIYDTTIHGDDKYLPIVTGNDNKLVGYLKCPTTVDGIPAYIYQDGTHSKIN